MKKNNNKYYSLLFFLILCISCHKKDEYHTIMDKVEAKQRPYHGGLSSEKLLEGTNLVSITEGEFTFLIPERKSQIKSFACVECHNKPLSKMAKSDMKKSHWNIYLEHANSKTMNCATCHDGQDMNSLKSLTGEKIDFNYSYQLCAQCHSSQFKDWKGGAHGKKVAGWAPPRASMTCVNCHNPHNPGFGHRLPAIYNTQKLEERKEGLGH